jgi:hypothetical protein
VRLGSSEGLVKALMQPGTVIYIGAGMSKAADADMPTGAELTHAYRYAANVAVDGYVINILRAGLGHDRDFVVSGVFLASTRKLLTWPEPSPVYHALFNIVRVTGARVVTTNGDGHALANGVRPQRLTAAVDISPAQLLLIGVGQCRHSIVAKAAQVPRCP